MADTSAPAGDLRSRKRAATMRHIQRVATGLFDEHGYDQVSIAQIAEAAEVGERSVYRYFGTKPMLLLYDEADTLALASFTARLGQQPFLDAVRDTVRELAPLLDSEVMQEARRRLDHVDRHLELQAALAQYVHEIGSGLGAGIASARGLAEDDLAAQVEARCVVAAVTAAIERWHRRGGPLLEELERALSSIEATFGSAPDS